MKETNQVATHPVPPVYRDEPQGLGLAQIIEGLADTLIEAGSAVRQWEEEAVRHRQHHLELEQKFEMVNARLMDHLLQINQRVTSMEEALSPITREHAKSAKYNARLIQRFEALEFNLEQVRLPVHVLAAQRGRFTLGVAMQPSPTTVPELLFHAVEILGCDHLILLCFDLRSLKPLAGALTKEIGAQPLAWVAASSMPAMHLILAPLNYECE